MADIKGTTRAQTNFLRAFRKSKNGPAAEDWPSPAILRRWLRSREFVQALNTLQVTLRVQADFQLISSAAAASTHIHRIVAADEVSQSQQAVKSLTEILKLAHVRERFASQNALPPPPICNSSVIRQIRRFHEKATVADVFEHLEEQGFIPAGTFRPKAA